MDIIIPALTVINLGPIKITDGLLGAILSSVVLVAFCVAAARHFSLIPTKMQVMFEMITDYVMALIVNAFKDEERARRFFPFFITLLLFLTVANQIALMPLVFEITTQIADGQKIDLIRQPTSVYAMPLAYALMVVVGANLLAFKISPIKHLSNFFNIGPLLKARSFGAAFNAIIDLGVGLLNIIGEFAKIVSLSARLFGNVFSGNVMITVIAGLAVFTQYIVPLPFIFLSTFSGFVQAFVFMLLSIQFIAMTIEGALPAQPELEEAEA